MPAEQIHPRFNFPTDLEAIRERVAAIDPPRYRKTRNQLDGDVTRLSPYFTHGVITLPEVRDAVLERFKKQEASKLLDELLWREFFQRVHEALGEAIFEDVREEQADVRADGVPRAVLDADSGVDVLDDSVRALIETGYVHNHARMYLASTVCNVAHCYWRRGADWFFYHLLDGDLASNTLNWQWCAGSFSHKKYWANQDNMNRFSGHRQRGTFLDYSYEELVERPVPEIVDHTSEPELPVEVPDCEFRGLTPGRPLLLYHMWNLNPRWRSSEDADRVLVIEPEFLKRHPMSPQRLRFALELAKGIDGLQVFVGDVAELPGLNEAAEIVSVKHPTTQRWPGRHEDREWLYPHVSGYFPSFSKFRKACAS
ncbi:FAD-binding domain-containing protein [Stratiformator vulcanicus]|uniref:Deoxyribodipyrimidine photo-lyase n=1 Tax=Stratiformator vulcanicus TaxID=2527980 RepID=A0A517R3N9_9PLAN|nr:FAD-binding domain-containing protein [Stratiformator vulcanicus]QDT38467.1 Deoxyribodipyrimidine photo-lyase [Stratiformator vulcanicus]